MHSPIIFIQGLRVAAAIGVYEHEKNRLQPLKLDAEIAVTPHLFAPHTDALHEVFDYQSLRTTMIDVVQREHIQLLETLADRVIHALLALPDVQSVRLRVSKFTAFADCDAVGIEVFRSRA